VLELLGLLFESSLTEALLEGAVNECRLSDAPPAHLAHLDVGVLEPLQVHDCVHQHVAEEQFVVAHQLGVQTGRGTVHQHIT